MIDFRHLPYRMTPESARARKVAALQNARQRAGANSRPNGFETTGAAAPLRRI